MNATGTSKTGRAVLGLAKKQVAAIMTLCCLVAAGLGLVAYGIFSGDAVVPLAGAQPNLAVSDAMNQGELDVLEGRISSPKTRQPQPLGKAHEAVVTELQESDSSTKAKYPTPEGEPPPFDTPEYWEYYRKWQRHKIDKYSREFLDISGDDEIRCAFNLCNESIAAILDSHNARMKASDCSRRSYPSEMRHVSVNNGHYHFYDWEFPEWAEVLDLYSTSDTDRKAQGVPGPLKEVILARAEEAIMVLSD